MKATKPSTTRLNAMLDEVIEYGEQVRADNMQPEVGHAPLVFEQPSRMARALKEAWAALEAHGNE